jgi:hypothetical protein
MLVFPKFWYDVRSHAESVVLRPGKDQVIIGCGSFEHELGLVAYSSGAGARLTCLSWRRVSWTRRTAGLLMRW